MDPFHSLDNLKNQFASGDTSVNRAAGFGILHINLNVRYAMTWAIELLIPTYVQHMGQCNHILERHGRVE